MRYSLTAPCLVLLLATAAADAADERAAGAADPPAAAGQPSPVELVFRAAHARGVCDVYLDFARWQPAHWPAGKAVREEFLTKEILPNYVAAAGLQDATPDQLEGEYRTFCEQSGDLYGRALEQLESQTDDATKTQRLQLAASLEDGRFVGQCQTASALYLQGDPARQEAVAPFVRDEVYAKDERYRQVTPDVEAARAGKVDEILAQKKSNEAKEEQYWRDCDEAQAELEKISEQLQKS
jgi:hypothetical protein